MTGHARGAILLGVLGLLAASCATVPPPQPVSPGAAAATPPAAPTTEPARPVASAVPPAGGPLRLAGEPMIAVGLAWDLDSLTVDAGSAKLRYDSAQRSAFYFANGPVAVVPSGGQLQVTYGRGGVAPDRLEEFVCRDTLELAPQASSGGVGTFRWNGREWRGTPRVFVNPRGRLTLVTVLPLESYLLGVVPGEIGGLSQSLLEAGRAQAIAARSYTLYYRGRRAAEGFDLYGTVEDQVYGSVETERPLASECVESTRGEVALHDGQPIRANYCADCGGITAEVWEAWPAAPAAYLESGRDGTDGNDYCTASPQHRWKERWSAEEFMANMRRYAPVMGLDLPPRGLGELVDVRVAARSRSGRVWRLLVRGSAGDLAIPSYAIRGVLRRGGRSDLILRSNLFKIAVRRDRDSGRAVEVVASGAGAGHGVGLCQTGALGMARRGSDARGILAHYYRHAEVRRLY